jgi:hypothetical protein
MLQPLESEIMKSKLTIRYISGREEQFEVELYGGPSAEDRLKDLAKGPALILQTEKEVVIIPATAIESATLQLPEPSGKAITFPGVRKAKRLK